MRTKLLTLAAPFQKTKAAVPFGAATVTQRSLTGNESSFPSEAALTLRAAKGDENGRQPRYDASRGTWLEAVAALEMLRLQRSPIRIARGVSRA